VTTQDAREKLWGAPVTGVVLLLMAGISVLLCLCISNQSLWMDEAIMAYFASHGGPAAMFSTVTSLREGSADPQMPLYIFYLWGWAKFFGTSEYALRAANMPFAILLVAALGWTSWRALGRPVLWIVSCCSPFVWFYMNEARPYMAIMACSAVSTGALLVYFAERDRYAKIAPWVCLSALLIAWGLQMLSAFLAPSLIVLAVLAMKEKRLAWNMILRDWTPALLIHMPFFLGLAVYFVWTLSIGAGGLRETPGFGNLAFALYEFMGFMGLGPPRHVLRAEHSLQVFIVYWPWLSIGLLTASAILSFSVFQIIGRQRDYLANLVLAWLTGLTLFVTAATAADFRFLGRHLVAFFPLFSFILISAIGEVATSRSSKHVGRLTVASVLCVWLISDARLWTLPQYQKDDYRLAASAALDAANRSDATILWAAHRIAGRYYGIDFEESFDGVEWQSLGKAVFAANWTKDQIENYLDSASAPVVLVLSKTDLFDAAGTWTAAIDRLQPRKLGSPNTFNIYIFEPDSVQVRHSKDNPSKLKPQS
jgi:hypothetical protein